MNKILSQCPPGQHLFGIRPSNFCPPRRSMSERRAANPEKPRLRPQQKPEKTGRPGSRKGSDPAGPKNQPQPGCGWQIKSGREEPGRAQAPRAAKRRGNGFAAAAAIAASVPGAGTAECGICVCSRIRTAARTEQSRRTGRARDGAPRPGAALCGRAAEQAVPAREKSRAPARAGAKLRECSVRVQNHLPVVERRKAKPGI